MKRRKHPWKKRKRTIPFNPDRDYLQSAIDNYLAKGGRISTVIMDEKSYRNFLEGGKNLMDADEFLLDQ